MKEEIYCKIEQLVLSIKNVDKKLIDSAQFIKELRTILDNAEAAEKTGIIELPAKPQESQPKKTRKMICSHCITMNSRHTKLMFQKPQLKPILENILHQCGYRMEMALQDIGDKVGASKHYVWYVFSALEELGLLTQERRGCSGYTYIINQNINKYL